MIRGVDDELRNIDERMAELASMRTKFIRKKAADSGWTPCDDCFDGFCCMNCSSAPTYMQVMI